MEQEKRCCKYCDHEIAGRTDKVFCNDYCRNSHHNIQPTGYLKQVRPILMILKRNRKILQEALRKSKGEPFDKQVLSDMGYNLRYCTEHKKLHKDNYYFCFDIGFTEHARGQLTLLRRDQFEFLSNPLPANIQQMLKINDVDGKGSHLRKNR